MPETSAIPKYRIDAILAALPYEERMKKRDALNALPARQVMLSKMRQAKLGDGFAPGGDALRTIANILGVTMDELYTANPEPDMHLPH